MTAEELWQTYQKINPGIGDEFDAWAFGVQPDLLAKLVLEGTKTATASAYDLYSLDQEPLPQVGTYDVVLDGQGQAVCIIQITKVEFFLLIRYQQNMLTKKEKGIGAWIGGDRPIRTFFNLILKRQGLFFLNKVPLF